MYTVRNRGTMRKGGYTHQLVFDWHPGDIHFCAADVGWVTGHSYIVYGPLANGATTVLFESTPVYPDPSRYWQVIDDVQATIFYTAPTALRALLRFGDEPVKKYKRDSICVLGSVGEPINPEVWQWYHDVVGDKRCAVVDTWLLSLPYRVRVLCAFDADLCALVRRLLLRAVSGHYERAARQSGVVNPRAGAVAFVQRFDSGLRVNLHFHVLWLDGVYGWEAGKGPARFTAAAEVTDAGVGRLVRAVRDRVVRALRRRGNFTSSIDIEMSNGVCLYISNQ